MQASLARAVGKSRKGLFLSWALLKTYPGLFVWHGVFTFLSVVLAFIVPLVLKRIVSFISNYQRGDEVPASIYVSAGLLFISPAVRAFVIGQQLHIGRRMIFRCRAAITALILRRTLGLDMSSASFSVGRICNLYAIDANSSDAVR